MSCVSQMVQTNQEPIKDTEKVRRNESNHDIKESCHSQEKSRRQIKYQRRITKKFRKHLTKWQYYIIIINYFNINGLNSPKTKVTE